MVLYVYACANCMHNARFKPMHAIEAKLCCHLMFQMSFRNIQRQKSYRNFLGDQSELLPSIFLNDFTLIWNSFFNMFIYFILRNWRNKSLVGSWWKTEHVFISTFIINYYFLFNLAFRINSAIHSPAKLVQTVYDKIQCRWSGLALDPQHAIVCMLN